MHIYWIGIRQKSKDGRKVFSAIYFLIDSTKNYFPKFKVQAVLQIKYIILEYFYNYFYIKRSAKKLLLKTGLLMTKLYFKILKITVNT